MAKSYGACMSCRNGAQKPLNAIAYGTLTGHLTRTLNALGLKREPIDVTPVVNEYLSTPPAENSGLLRLLPAGALGRVGLAPNRKRRLSRRTPNADLSERVYPRTSHSGDNLRNWTG